MSASPAIAFLLEEMKAIAGKADSIDA